MMKKMDKIITETINNFLHENIETEYLDKNFGIPLKKYLNMSDEDKGNERIWRYFYRFYDFLCETNLIEPLNNEQCTIIQNACNDYDEELVMDIINNQFDNDVKEDFAKWLEYNNEFNSIPTYDIMDYTKDIHNEWLVHFSDNAGAIADEGFRYATYDMDNLGYSNAGETDGKCAEGWDFAYLASYVNDYYAKKYGREAVMFRASGIQATHYGDEEEQVMFWNKDAKDIVYIEHGGDYNYERNSRGEYVSDWYICSRITGDVLYDSDNIEDVISWVMNNFEQYRKHLINKKASKIKNNSLKNSEHNYRYNIK